MTDIIKLLEDKKFKEVVVYIRQDFDRNKTLDDLMKILNNSNVSSVNRRKELSSELIIITLLIDITWDEEIAISDCEVDILTRLNDNGDIESLAEYYQSENECNAMHTKLIISNLDLDTCDLDLELSCTHIPYRKESMKLYDIDYYLRELDFIRSDSE